jgi:hypothetical protein
MRAAVRLMSALGAIIVVFASQFAWVRATNFGGWDEWLVIDLTYRGIVSLPYQNRPFSLAPTLPGSLLSPHGLWGFYVVHGLYLVGTGVLLYLIVRRLAPGHPDLALLAGIFAPSFSPADDIRLDLPLTASYAGVTFFGLLALFLLLESYRRRSLPVLAAVAILGGLVTRCVEATVGLMAAGPLLLLAAPAIERRSWWRFTLVWGGAVGVAAASAAWPVLFPPPGGSYQTSGLGFDPQPARVAARVARQFAFHLLPLLTPIWEEMATRAAALTAAVFLVSAVVLLQKPDADEPRTVARLALIGIVGAGLGYGVLALSPAIQGPARAEIVSAPGIALFLAAVVSGVGARLGRARRPILALLGAWIVAVGTARVAAMQRQWDETSYWPRQRQTLSSLLSAAPSLLPDTFVVLLDGTGSFPATFTFHHALDYLYGRRVSGVSVGAEPFLYPHFFSKVGVVSVPLDSIRGPWREPVRVFGYDQLVVVREQRGGGVRLLEQWPEGELPALPPGATYRPRERIRVSGERRPEIRILGLESLR